MKLESENDVLSVLEACDKSLFPNIHTLLEVLATLPITTCTAERSLSTMKRLKTPLRNSTGHDRLSDLAVLSTHWEIDVSEDEVLDRMLLKNRRLLF